MKTRKIYLTLDECSEIRICLSKKIVDVKRKLNALSDNIPGFEEFDKQSFSYWLQKYQTLTDVFSKLTSLNFGAEDEN